MQIYRHISLFAAIILCASCASSHKQVVREKFTAQQDSLQVRYSLFTEQDSSTQTTIILLDSLRWEVTPSHSEAIETGKTTGRSSLTARRAVVISQKKQLVNKASAQKDSAHIATFQQKEKEQIEKQVACDHFTFIWAYIVALILIGIAYFLWQWMKK